MSEILELYPSLVGGTHAREYDKLYEILTDYNGRFNLTAIKTPADFLSKHVADCATAAECIAKLILSGGTLLDVGSGAGFPALPIAIEMPDVSVTALDSTAKKIGYITDAAAMLGLTNVSGIVGRAEEVVTTKREQYDVVTARAVARLNVLVELCAPFVKVGGYFVAMKGMIAEEEANEAAAGAKQLGLAPCEIKPYTLPGLDDSRAFVIYRKLSPTPDRFPRQYAKIVKNPLR